MSANRRMLRGRFGRNPSRVIIGLAALSLLAAACGSNAQASVVTPKRPVLHEATDSTIGITNTAQGFTFDSPMAMLDGSQTYQFRILGPDGQPQTRFLVDQTKFLHLLVIRDDL